ncbi:energy-coupling factor ABC transporter ATP-binding protein [Brevibacillus dissolubilis]|uniref:energy-coupling factor ABC transporter ATP-binding protein n=1 Tax=Brevibacillus dissolubilis TaxID=1844116 RepID=UPI0011163ECA|nr:ABC transporter ATP-binding protein [Brevibacillus dissolubilis]
MTTTQNLLELIDITYTYPLTDRPALDQLTLRIPEGKKTVLLGQNGSGKSTFFLHSNGIHRPDRGEVRWKGEPLRYDRRSLMELRRLVGLVFQDPEQQLVASTVEADISYGLCNLGLSDAEVRERVCQALERFDLTAIARNPVHHLSLGQKKQVALAGVMVLAPKLLILDEPTAYLDQHHTNLLLRQCEQIHESGTTILMATHDLNLAYAWADWVLVMHQGKLLLEGEPHEVFAQREVLEEIHLGVPLLYEVWETLQEAGTVGASTTGAPTMETSGAASASFSRCIPAKAPRTIEEFRRLFHS